jgi:hypothetical protein
MVKSSTKLHMSKIGGDLAPRFSQLRYFLGQPSIAKDLGKESLVRLTISGQPQSHRFVELRLLQFCFQHFDLLYFGTYLEKDPEKTEANRVENQHCEN